MLKTFRQCERRQVTEDFFFLMEDTDGGGSVEETQELLKRIFPRIDGSEIDIVVMSRGKGQA